MNMKKAAMLMIAHNTRAGIDRALMTRGTPCMDVHCAKLCRICSTVCFGFELFSIFSNNTSFYWVSFEIFRSKGCLEHANISRQIDAVVIHGF